MNSQFFINNLWRWKCGLPENEPGKPIVIDKLQKSEWSIDFENLMRNRLIMGAFRYGILGSSNKPKFDRVSSIIKRINLYNVTGNQEYLVDVANLCLIEFVEGSHPLKHFNSIDDGEHVKTNNP